MISSMRVGTTFRICALVGVMTLVALRPHAAHAQSERANPTTIALHAGTWSIGKGHWPRLALSLEQAINSFAVRAELWAVSRPVTLCAGFESPDCDERKLMRGLSLGGRLVDRGGRWHPYAGAGFGFTHYKTGGAQVYGELGMHYDVAPRWGAELRLGADILAAESDLTGADMLSLGARYHVSR